MSAAALPAGPRPGQGGGVSIPAWTGACTWGKDLPELSEGWRPLPGSPSRRPWGLTADTPQSWAPCVLLPASSRASALCLVGIWGVPGGAPCWLIPQAPQASWAALRSAGAVGRASPHILTLTGLR